MNASEVKSLLVNRIEDVCAHLLPGGKRKGAEWCCGSTAGEAGDSLKVRVAGEASGVWKDFAGSADDTGDVFSLWQKCRNLDFVTALKEAKAWLGVSDTRDDSFRPVARSTKTYVRPPIDGIEPVVSGGRVFDYLTKNRQIQPAMLHAYKIGQMQHGKFGATIVFSVYDPRGKAVEMVKYLAVERTDGEKRIWSSADSKPRLFGWQAIKPDAREVVICEGEIDCLTIAGWGYACLSVPQGATNMDWVESDYEALERFEKILICSDMDAPGQKLAGAIAQRLGRERCYRVSLSEHKDANAALCSGRFLDPDFDDVVASARTLDPAELRNLGDMENDIWEAVYPSDQRNAGTESPYNIDWKCRHGELTVWTGWSGHGKSHILNQFLLHDAHQGEKICIASFEMPAGETGAKIAQMALGAFPKQSDRAALKPCVEFLASHFWVVDVVGVMHWSKLIPIMTYAARRYGCTRFAVDSLLRLGVAEDDYNGQKDATEAFVNFAATYGHVHIVAHARKADDESKAPGKLDVRGAAAITDLCHNGFTVWRNKAKEQQIEEAQNSPVPMGVKQSLYAMPDAQISMWKNRKKGSEPFRKLWLHRTSGQFLESFDRRPFQYMPADCP